ncbi:MAG: hypothetical protein K6B14_11960 [Lachnospiraceae bacterium]|nr:hypothetical protein [Lachnospiraceae bacterium]
MKTGTLVLLEQNRDSMMDSDHYEAEKKRFRELYDRADRTGLFQFTDFHSQQGVVLAETVGAAGAVSAWGGFDDAERKMVRFGDPDDIGYEEDFPITVIRIEPKVQKYADKLTHRDFLGTLMNLGIERSVLGDIIVYENTGYLMACSRISAFLMDNISQVRHTAVKLSILDSLPEEARPRVKHMDVNVSSLRLDGMIAHVFHLSRGESKALFSSEKVYIKGMPAKNAAVEPDDGDIISVHGHGKFRFCGVLHETKRGHYVVGVERFV